MNDTGEARRRVRALTTDDMAAYPVWEYCLEEESQYGEDMIAPVTDLPVASLDNRIVATRVKLANGAKLWAVMSNVSLSSSLENVHFLSLSVFCNGEWLDLARYHDVDYETNGPRTFASKLGLSVEQVFPICYDIAAVAIGEPDVIQACVHTAPEETFTSEEIIHWAATGVRPEKSVPRN